MLDLSNLPNDFDGLSSREVALRICAPLQERNGVDLISIMSCPKMSFDEKRRAMVEALLCSKFEREYQAGNEFFMDETEQDTAEIITLDEMLKAEIDIEPNLSFSTANADVLRTYTGSTLKTYVYNLTKRFENMEKAATPGQLALEIVGGALLSVGVPMAVGTYKAMGPGIKFLAALKKGITGIGMKTAVAAIVVVLVVLLLYLFLENPKKILGFIINKTDHDFKVKNWNNDNKGDLFMQHGHMVDFMEDNKFGDLSAPKVQIQAMVDFGDSDPESFVFAGVFFADRNFGLRGAEGVMRFTSLDNSLRFAQMFAVPYFQDNGTNICVLKDSSDDMSKLFRTMYDNKAVRKDYTDQGFKLTSTVNDARGGVVACIASISK
ncbi:hypothetical protein [Amylibacter sp. SFDW26]|uniref:hypothetical protein n=1 Tax=Amylibacter sp. SFDW26 TaxID=2652722 RepID=UPI001D005DA4|nr:hypothetical protein [Amylibacter sp. SFDW26]